MAKRKKNRKQQHDDDMTPTKHHRPRSSHPHVAQEYLEMGSPETAYSLTRQLTRDAQRAVLG